MKKIIFLIAITAALYSCKKADVANNTGNQQQPTETVLANGTFVSSVHPTSGTAKLVKDSVNKLHLRLDNFRTDSGPDLRVWLCPDTNASSYVEAGDLTVYNGNFRFSLPDSVNYSSNKYVLIWCEDFSVLFGYAVLQ